MIRFTTIIKRFDRQGEKTGWTYIDVVSSRAEQLNPANRKGFRVKGKLDTLNIEGLSLIPMGGGDFILPLNHNIRKAIGKTKGALLNVELHLDTKEYQLCAEFLECLADEPQALEYFNSLPPSHRNYYSKWIESAKTEPTKIKRIAHAVTAMARGMGYGEMLRTMREEREVKIQK